MKDERDGVRDEKCGKKSVHVQFCVCVVRNGCMEEDNSPRGLCLCVSGCVCVPRVLCVDVRQHKAYSASRSGFSFT
jgi:hypothetical protein